MSQVSYRKLRINKKNNNCWHRGAYVAQVLPSVLRTDITNCTALCRVQKRPNILLMTVIQATANKCPGPQGEFPCDVQTLICFIICKQLVS